MKKTERINKSLLVLGLTCVLWLTPFQGMASNLIGDINNDGNINVTDVTLLINKVLKGDTQWTQDMNGDGQVTIADVTLLISCVLKGTTPPGPQGPTIPDNAVIYTVNGYQIVMVPVEGGTFMMGSGLDSECASPVHQVTLSDYSICMTEVTMGLWKAVTGSYPPNFNTALDKDTSPVYFCSWDTARDFCARLNELTGLSFHLPTEAQWEFAARGGNLSHGYKYAGSDDIDEVACYNGNTPLNTTITVCLRKPNELGLYDMSGGVMEFCEDDFIDYSGEPQVDPLVIASFSYTRAKVLRGGSYYRQGRYCTVTNRKSSYGSYHGVDVGDAGLRLAL